MNNSDTNNAEIIAGSNPGEFIICGELNFVTANNLLQRGNEIINKLSDIHFNFAKVSQSSSVGLALLAAWSKNARQAGKQFTASNLPTRLLSAAKVSNLDTILPIR